MLLALSAGAAAQSSPCAAEPTFVEAFVAGQTRGGTLAVILPDGVWVDPQILRASEANYAGSPVTCALGRFAPLNPQVDVRFDPAELTLTIRPQLNLLPGNTLDLNVPAQIYPPDATQPLLTASVEGTLSRTQPGQATLSYHSTVHAGVSVGAGSGTVRVMVAGQPGSPPERVNLQAQATYDFTDQLSGAARVNATRADGQTTLSTTQITGVQLTAGDRRAYRLPELTFELPLDATVDLTVDGQALPAVRATAGTLRLRNIPLTSAAGLIEARITDDTGSRIDTRRYELRDLTVTARAFSAQVQAGLKGTERAASLQGAYGITDQWSVTGQAELTGTDWDTQVGVRYATNNLNAGLSLTARPQAMTVAGNVALRRDAWQFGLSAQVTPLNLAASSVGGQVGWSGKNRNVTAEVQARPGQQAYVGKLSASARVNPQLTVSARAQVSREASQTGWLGGVTLTWLPRQNLTVATSGAVAASLAATRWEASSAVSWSITPEQTLTAAAQFSTLPERAARLGYSYVGPVAAAAAASTNGTWEVSGRAGVAWVAGRTYLTPDDPGPGLLVQAGVPGIPLRVNGTRVVTDARGEALVLLAPGTREVSVTPDFDTLPVTVSVREELRVVTMTGQGAAVVDWTGNFEAFVWVQLLDANGVPLPYASVDVQGARRADDEGWVLIPTFKAPLSASVTVDGAVSATCQVTLTPGVESARCAP